MEHKYGRATVIHREPPKPPPPPVPPEPKKVRRPAMIPTEFIITKPIIVGYRRPPLGTVVAILNAVSVASGIRTEVIRSRCRAPEVVSARRAIVYMCREFLHVTPSYPDINNSIRAVAAHHSSCMDMYRCYGKDALAKMYVMEALGRVTNGREILRLRGGPAHATNKLAS